MSKFKDGDRVRVVRQRYSTEPVGTEGVLLSFRGQGAYLSVAGKTIRHSDGCYFYPLTHLEHIASATILESANELIYGERAEAYGEFSEQAALVAKQFEIILNPELQGRSIPVEKVALLMDGLKTVRLAQNPTHTDSWKDKAGYVGCAGKLDSIWPERKS